MQIIKKLIVNIGDSSHDINCSAMTTTLVFDILFPRNKT